MRKEPPPLSSDADPTPCQRSHIHTTHLKREIIIHLLCPSLCFFSQRKIRRGGGKKKKPEFHHRWAVPNGPVENCTGGLLRFSSIQSARIIEERARHINPVFGFKNPDRIRPSSFGFSSSFFSVVDWPSGADKRS